MSLKKVNDVLMYILIWFIIYSSALNYTYLPVEFSYIKDIIIYYFAFLLIKNGKVKKPTQVGTSFYVLFSLVLIFSWTSLINTTNNGKIAIIVRCFRYIEFFLLFFIFSNFENICTIDYKKIINWYIKLSVILIFIHIFGYFVPNPIVSIYIDNKIGNGFYRNRISIGQPAIAVYPMIISYIYLLCYNERGMTKNKVINICLLLIGIIISISTTGIISVIITIICFIFLNKDSRNTKNFFKIIVVVSFFIGISFITISQIPKLTQIYNNASDLLSVKLRSIYVDNIVDNSMKSRDLKYQEALKNWQSDDFLKNAFIKAFGIGILGYNYNSVSVGSLENSFRMMKICFGYIGFIFFVFFLLGNLIRSLIKEKNNDRLFLVLLWIVFIVHSYTLEVLYLPTISYSMSLFYCYIKNTKTINEIKE